MSLGRSFGELAGAVTLAAGLMLASLPAVALPDWPGSSWQATLLRAHPLVGTIWDARAATRVMGETVVARLEAARHRLIGEIHDNPDHHRIQAWLVGAMHRTGGSGTVVFEHIRADQAGALAQFVASPAADRSTARLFDLLDWDKSGWPPRALFQPLFAAVLDKGLSIVPGDAARTSVRSVARQGASALDAPEQARLALAEGLPELEQAALLDELEASHCGLMPRTAFGGMALAQRYRDAHLARAMVDAAAVGPVILIAGNGHVHAGRGVPWHLARMTPDAAIVTVALIEVMDGKTDAAAAVPKDAAGNPAADFVIFTPRVDRDDPCVAMRRAFAPKPQSKP